MNSLTLAEALASQTPTISFEFFPPKDGAAELSLMETLQDLKETKPSFVSVTYGAGGSNRDRSLNVTKRIVNETGLMVVGHLTCVNQDRAQLTRVIEDYAAAGVQAILALRGDPVGGPGSEWVSVPDGFDHARDLVELIAQIQPEISIGVAAFPQGHPEAPDLEFDAKILAEKARAGASFAVTQFFYEVDEYLALVERVRAQGVEIPIVPGIMPIESLKQVETMARLSGSQVPHHIKTRLTLDGDDAQSIRARGIDHAAELSQALLDAGAPGLHFYTLNKSRATREVYARLRMGA